jgi:predicted TIM-barrel fold metal-dependent hydrolase
MKFNGGIFDAHLHTHGGCGVDAYLRNGIDNLSAAGIDGANLLCVKHGRSSCMTDPEALLLKAMVPGKFTVYFHPAIDFEGFDNSPDGLRRQVQSFINAGADGVKIADGNFKKPIDSPEYTPMFSLIEETGFPVTFHNGSTIKIPPRRVFAKNRYAKELPPFMLYQPGKDDDAGEQPGAPKEYNETRYAQIENLLNRHPNARITFPHMLYMSDDLGRLSSFLDRHPSVNVDLTPVPEIYYHFAQNVKRAREFLVAYQDRVFLGTDNDTESDPLPVIINFRRFFESDETFFVPRYGFDMKGLAPFPEEARKKIYRESFLRMCDPKPLNPKKAAVYCESMYEQVRGFSELPEPNKEEILEVAKRLKAMR